MTAGARSPALGSSFGTSGFGYGGKGNISSEQPDAGEALRSSRDRTKQMVMAPMARERP